MAITTGTLFDDTLLGTANTDVVYGWQGHDFLQSGDGNDILYGDEGDDTLIGGPGDDLLAGGQGNDVLNGEEGNDIFYGGAGNDILIGGLGSDRLFGDSGFDTFYLEWGADTVTGGKDKDTFILFPTLGGISLAEAAIITDFNPLEDELELSGGLSFAGLNIFQGTENYANDTIIQDRNTGRYLAILLNVATPRLLEEVTGETPTAETEVSAEQETEQPFITFAGPAMVMSPTPMPGNSPQTPPDDTLPGTQADDTLPGTQTDDTLPGTQTDDTLPGTQTDDTLPGTQTDDTLPGTQTDDTLPGTQTDDTLPGTQADDTLPGTQADDTLPGTQADDTLSPNEAPTNIILSNTSIPEYTNNGAMMPVAPMPPLIALLSTVDPDERDTHTYTLIDNAGGRFAIIDNELAVGNARLLDFETATSHTIIIQTTDSAGNTFDKPFTINVTDVNEFPTDIDLSESSIDENSPNGTVLGNLTPVDPDEGDTHTYSLINTAGGRFAIEEGENRLIVTNGTLLDYETATRHIITVQVTDSEGLTFEKDLIIEVNDTPDPPMLDLDGIADDPDGDVNFSTNFISNSGPVPIVDATTLTLSDIDSTEMTGATITITNLLDGANEILDATPVGNITASYSNGVLTLSGTDTLANYQQVLRSLTYDNTAASANPLARTIEFIVTDDEGASSAVAITTLNIGPNTPPELDLNGTETGIDYSAIFNAGMGAVAVVDSTNLTVTDVNNPSLRSATVTITNLFNGGDESLAATTTGTNITASYDSATGILTLSGTDTLANYQQVLQSVTYNNINPLPDTTERIIELVVNDGTAESPVATTTLTLNTDADLELTQLVSNPNPNIEDNLTFTLDLINNGPAAATNIAVTNQLPGGMEGVAVTPSIGTYDPNTGIWTVPNLASTGNATLTISGIVRSYGTIVNTAEVTAVDQPAPDSTPNNFIPTEDDIASAQADIPLPPGGIQLSDILAGIGGFGNRGMAVGEEAGCSVRGAGDVNGDGLADVIVGAWVADLGSLTDAGKSYVVFGKTNNIAVDLSDIAAGTGGFVINGMAASDLAGASVSSAGDVNGDGLDDVMVSSHQANPAGKSYVVFGKTDGTSVNLSNVATGTGGFVINGINSGEQSGGSLSGAGDVNGDGLDDVIVGARFAGSNDGKSYVVFGKTDSTAVNLSNVAAGTGGFVINGLLSAQEFSGVPVSIAGDVNGDGLDDLMIGARYADPGGRTNAGKSYVVFGKANGTAVDLSEIAAGNGGFVINGIVADDHSGIVLNRAGDVNGDGLDDLIIAARYADPGGRTDAGESYVVFGKTDGTAVNLSEIAAGNGGFVINGIAAHDKAALVSNAGDVNGDGLDDLIIGANEADPGGITDAGESYVVFGKTDSTTVNLSEIAAGNGGFVINGIAASDSAGAVSSAGDVNGDGFDDLIVGAAGADPGSLNNAGEFYIVWGGNFSNSVTQQGGIHSDWLQGTTAADVLIGGQGDDTLIGGGGADVLYGGIGDDLIGISDAGFKRIKGGRGTDTLRLDGAFNLNLTAIANNKITGIEIINLNGNNNGLMLDSFDVKALSDFTSGGLTRLIVDGVAGNSVTSTGGWVAGATTVLGSNSYNTYTLDGAWLWVDTDISQGIS